MEKTMSASSHIYFILVLISLNPSNATLLDSIVTSSPLIFPKFSPSESWQAFNSSSEFSSSIRARFLKQKKFGFYSYKIPIIPTELGGLIQLSFGTPPQTLHFFLDTASRLTWFPCGSNYSSSNYNNSSLNKYFTKFEMFSPNLSSSSKNLVCNHPKYQVLAGSRVQCENCKKNNSNKCLQPLDYTINYGEGSTTGIYLLETLNFPQKIINGFVVGCSSSSNSLPIGIAGFSPRVLSFPSQLGTRKFSYCMSGGPFNGKPQGSYILLNDNSQNQGVSYTPFHNSLRFITTYYYYVILEKIMVGRSSIEIPYEILVPGYDAYGGTILDAASTFTLMENTIFQVVVSEVRKWLGQETWITNINKVSCFNVSGIKIDRLPKFKLVFQGGSVMKLDFSKLLMNGSKKNIQCLGIVPKPRGVSLRPAIVLGNMMLRDIHMEHDLKNHRFGFRVKKCS